LKADAAASEEAEAASEGLGAEVERTAKSYEKLKSAVDILNGALSNRDAFDAAIQAQNELIWAQAEAAKGGEGQAAAQAAVDEAVRNSIDALVNYIDTLGGIPEAKATQIAALINEGSFAAAEERLRILARNRQAEVQIVTRGGAGYGPIAGARAAGGPVSAGKTYLVGEEGPELMVPGSNGTVVPSNKLRTATGSGGSTSNTYSITVNVAPGGDPASTGRALVEAIQDYERVNSSRWRAS
jgi:hypothetical protein